MAPTQHNPDPEVIFGNIPMFTGDSDITIEKVLLATDEAAIKLGLDDQTKIVVAKTRFVGRAGCFWFMFPYVKDYESFQDIVIRLFSNDAETYCAEKEKFEGSVEREKGFSYFIDRYLKEFTENKRCEEDKGKPFGKVFDRLFMNSETENEINVEGDNSLDQEDSGENEADDKLVLEIQEKSTDLKFGVQMSEDEIPLETVTLLIETEEMVVAEANLVDIVSEEYEFIELGESTLEGDLLAVQGREKKLDSSIWCKEQVSEKFMALELDRDFCKGNGHGIKDITPRRDRKEINVDLFGKVSVEEKLDGKRRENNYGNVNNRHHDNEWILKCSQDNLSKFLNWKFRKKLVSWVN